MIKLSLIIINIYKIDRLNAEISAFSSGDLNKYEFLMRKDLKYKPNALDKARFEFSPSGKTISTGLDKTAQDYQEEGVIKLLKDIRDGLRGGVSRIDDDRPDNNDDRPDNNGDRPDNNNDRPDNNNDRPDNNDDRPDHNDDRPDNNDDRPDNNDDRPHKILEHQKVFDYVLKNYINNNSDDNEISNVKSDGDYYARLISYQNATIKKLEKEITDRKNLTKDIIDETSKTINEIKKTFRIL